MKARCCCGIIFKTVSECEEHAIKEGHKYKIVFTDLPV